MKQTLTLVAGLFLLFFAAAPSSGQAFEDLTTSTLATASGTGITSGGVGTLETGGGVIDITVPAGATIEQVVVYWGGRARNGNQPEGQDDDILVDGNDVTGTLVGTAGVAGVGNKAFTFGADITALGVVSDGANSITIAGFEDPNPGTGDFRADGASIVVIYSVDGDEEMQFFIRDGADLAYVGFPGASMVTNLQTFTFEAADYDREATLINIAGDTNIARGDRLTVTVDGVVVIDQLNYFQAGAGLQWSNREETITIPAGATEVTVQVFSEKLDPEGPNTSAESITWIFVNLAVPQIVEDEPGCTYTRGFWLNHPEDWPVDMLTLGDEVFTQEQLLEILSTPARGDKSLILAQQLIASKLNVANGADDSEIAGTIADADQWLIDNGGVGSGQRNWNGGEELKNMLDAYNNGEIGPGHCDDTAQDGGSSNATTQTGVVTEITAYPNPVSDFAMIKFTLAERTQINVAVYDVMGRQVAVLAEQVFEAGTHRLPFDASNLATGVYLYRVELPTGVETGRMSVVR